MKSKKTFTLKEVEKLVKFAYETGLCDGLDSCDCGGENWREYSDAEDFWQKNVKNWTTKEITYIV